jgi:hypothetical protein
MGNKSQIYLTGIDVEKFTEAGGGVADWVDVIMERAEITTTLATSNCPKTIFHFSNTILSEDAWTWLKANAADRNGVALVRGKFVTCEGMGIDSNGGKVENVADPTLAQDTVTKAYADGTVENMASPTVNLTWIGTHKQLQAAVITTQFQLAYTNGSSKMALAKADAEATSKGMLAIAGEALALDATGKYILPKSLIRNDAWTWTPGGELYISEITAGAITQTAPAAVAGNVVRVIGYAISATVILYDPDKTWIVIG